MHTMTPAPILFFHLLADRNGAPAGLLFGLDLGLDLGRTEADADAEAVAAAAPPQADLLALSARFPCYYEPALPAPLAAALQQGGWRALDDASLLRSDAPLERERLAPQVRWIAGDWCLNPPAKVPGRQPASRALALQLVQLVAADADTHEIEALLRHDPTLSYHLLRLVNSLGMGTGRRVTSFSQAILILGRQQLRRWLNLMLFAACTDDVRSNMLLARVAVRARAMELLAKACGMDKPTQEQAFMSGMFSLLGILFGMSMDELLKPLMMSEAVQAALLSHEGELGALLALLETAERADLAALATRVQALQLAPEEFNRIVLEANLWMLGAISESLGDAHA